MCQELNPPRLPRVAQPGDGTGQVFNGIDYERLAKNGGGVFIDGFNLKAIECYERALRTRPSDASAAAHLRWSLMKRFGAKLTGDGESYWLKGNITPIQADGWSCEKMADLAAHLLRNRMNCTLEMRALCRMLEFKPMIQKEHYLALFEEIERSHLDDAKLFNHFDHEYIARLRTYGNNMFFFRAK